VTVSATVKNTGDRPGEEVVQFYVHDEVASKVRPRRELKGFQKVRISPGESKTVSFLLDKSELMFHGPDAKPVIEPGTFIVWVAPSSLSEGGGSARFNLLPPSDCGGPGT